MSDAPACLYDGCKWPGTYWYIETGRRLNSCFGHAVHAAMTSGNYGRWQRKDHVDAA